MNELQKNKLDVDSFRENYKEFIKSNKLILKLQKVFRSQKHNVLTEQFNMNCPNNDKRIQSLYSIKSYTYGTNKTII